ncbi:MAG: HAMP domain-containing sensor histidine kinase [Pseudanabaena sp. ELA748]
MSDIQAQLFWLLVGIVIGAIAASACWFSWNYAKQKRNRQQRKRSHHAFKAKSARSFKSWAQLIHKNIKSNISQDYREKIEDSKPTDAAGLLLWGKILESAPIGYVQVDQDNRLAICNQKAATMMGIVNHQQGLIRKPFLLQLIRSYELDHLVEQTRSQQIGSQVDWVFHPAIPDPVDPVPQVGRPIRAHSFYLNQGEVGIFLEDRREAVAITQQRDRWTSDIAHELKTPLTSIRLVAETIEPRVDPAARIWIDRLINEIDRMTKLVQDLLELGQMDVGIEPQLNLSEVNLSTIVRSVCLTLEPIANRKQVKLKHIGDQEIIWQLDESRIYRLLLNLLDNSIKHSPAIQSITIKTSVVDSNLHIETIDAGSGFPEESLPHIFDRFYQIDPSRTRSGIDRGGSGLGLAIARQIVILHKGAIAAQNHPETGGAWITITLPDQNLAIENSSSPEYCHL